MRRLAGRMVAVLASRAVTPLLVLLLFLLYVGIAFVSEEPLVTLMGVIRSNPPLVLLLAFMPVNLVLRALRAVISAVRRRALARGRDVDPGGLFDAEVEVAGGARWDDLAPWLSARGYRVLPQGDLVVARRGLAFLPARLLLLLGACALCIGIGLSVLTRHSVPTAIIEGEPLPGEVNPGARVERIILRADPQAWLLNRKLTVRVSRPTGELVSYRLYPPGLAGRYFLYPRYLGLAPLVAFSAPDLAPRRPDFYTLMLYPPGREDTAEFRGTPYKIWFSLESPPSGADPLVSGEIVLVFRVVREGKTLFEGSLPAGGSFSKDGFTLAVPQVRRVLATDFVYDPGLVFLWLAFSLLTAGLLCGGALRLFAPRGELLFRRREGGVRAWFRSEGRARAHAGVFHEALDLLCDEPHR